MAIDSNDGATVATTFRVFEHEPVVEGGPLLHLAASRDLAGAVSGLLDSSVPQDWTDEEGKDAYYIAVSTGSGAVSSLLAEKAAPDHLKLMRLALNLAEVQTADKFGLLGMAEAMEAGDTAAAGRLLRANARLITLPKDEQDSFVSWAVRNGEAEWLTLFLKNGAFVDDTDLGGDPLLYIALESEQFDTAEYLVEHGAAVDSQTARTGESAMHAAVRLGPEWVDRLLTERAIPDLADKTGRTPLHAAVDLGRMEIIPKLIDAKADTSMQDGDGSTPVMLAAKKRDTEMVDLLLPVTVAIDVQDGRGQTLIHHVVAQKHMPTLSTLIDRQARLDLADEGGDTPLHVALGACSDVVARALHDAGAPLQPPNKAGERAIHLAARCGDDGIVEASLEDRVSVNVTTVSGRTPLHEAAAAGKSRLAQMLLENQADRRLRDEEGARPTKLARKAGHRDTRLVISRYKPPKDERVSPVSASCRGSGSADPSPLQRTPKTRPRT